KAWNGLEKITSKAWNSVKNTIVNIVGAIWKPLSKTFSKIVDAVSDAWNDILKATKRIWNRILDKISDVLGGIWKAIKRKFDDIKDTISGALDAIKSKWNSIWDGIKQKVSDIWGSIKGIVHDGVKAIGNFWNTGANGLEKVAGFFGAKISVPKFKQGSSGPVARPMLAMVNDQEGP
ncbi:phage tail protein, partial [Ligilactobacillus salivarius]|uniref:phage tail protein n=1 Tax=Ligilactobacillus salivarius TaxID=1624 RepID=UPI0024BAE22F